MLLFLTLTHDCNLRCTYCGSAENYDIEDLAPHPKDLSFNFNQIAKFKEVKDLILCFYGGEPLLKKNLILEAMKMLPNATYVLQTNATMLQQFGMQNVMKMDTILTSIDGEKRVTDYERGQGTYDKVVENCRYIRANGYKNDLIARMTTHEQVDIYEAVTHLLSLKETADGGKLDDKRLYDHIHWQLDVCWDSPKFARWNDYLKWRDESYNPGISKLIDLWIEHMKNPDSSKLPRYTANQTSAVLGIAPFQRIMYSLLTGEKIEGVRCGAGIDSFNVTTAGTITACPIAPVFKELDSVTNPKFNANKLEEMCKEKITGPCLQCPNFNLCGGRCLATNKDMWWGEDGMKEVCVTIYHLINELKRVKPEVEKLIAEGKVTLEDFLYPKYNNTIEVIP